MNGLRMLPILLGGILAVALGVRVWGIEQGYPDLYGHVDEVGVAASIWNFFRSGTLRPTEFTYPDLYSYLVAALVWLSALFGAGELDDTGDALVLLSFADPAWAVLLGRLLSAVASTLSVAIVYRLGCEVFGRRSGVLGALFLAVSSMATQQAHRALPDTVMALFATLCIYYSWKLYCTGSWRHYAIAGVTAGLMVSTKYNGAFVSFALVAAHVLRTILSGGLRAGRVLADGRLWMAVGLSIVALVAATPYLILAWKQYLSVVSYQTSSLAFSMSQTHAWLWIAQAYLTEEYLLGALMLGGLTLAFVRRHPFDWMLLAAWVPSFLYIGTWTRESLHYLLQFHPVLALMAARLVTVLWDHGRAHARARSGLLAGAMVVVIVAGALIINGVRVVEAGRLLTVPDTRALAGKWIEAHVPAGSKVAMTWLPYCPRLDMISARESILRYAGNRPGVRQALREQWLSRPAFRFVNLEGWLKQPVVPEAYRDHIDLDDPETRRVFSRGWRSLEILKRDGVQWVVLPEAVYERYMGAAEPMANTAAHYRYTSNRAYFASLMAAESGLKLVARFPTDSASEGSGEQEPPLPSRGGGISIYRVL